MQIIDHYVALEGEDQSVAELLNPDNDPDTLVLDHKSVIDADEKPANLIIAWQSEVMGNSV